MAMARCCDEKVSFRLIFLLVDCCMGKGYGKASALVWRRRFLVDFLLAGLIFNH